MRQRQANLWMKGLARTSKNNKTLLTKENRKDKPASKYKSNINHSSGLEDKCIPRHCCQQQFSYERTMKARPCQSHYWNSWCPSCTVIFVKWKSLSQHTEECVLGWPSRGKGKREHVRCHSPSISNHGNGSANSMLEKNRFLVTITLWESSINTFQTEEPALERRSQTYPKDSEENSH